ncbi:transposase [Pseudobacteroides cellulosolvens]
MGQNLSYNPHVHYVVTDGGINVDSKKWISSKKGYLLPVKY